MFNEHKPIRIVITNNEGELQMTLPWDANLEDWTHAFKTILFWSTFSPENIDEVFYDEEKEFEANRIESEKKGRKK